MSGQNRVRSKVRLVLDDSSTDKTPAIQTWRRPVPSGGECKRPLHG